MNQKNTKKELKSILNNTSQVSKRKQVIYGVYDRARQPMFTRINDFLIDHSRVPLEEKAYFYHLLAVMIDAGIPLIKSLRMLANRTKSERFSRVLNTVAYNITQGKSMSEGMARFPDVFGEMETGVVSSGEAAGNLDKMLFKLAEQIEKSHSLQVKLLTAAIYPIAVLCVMIVVAAGMLIWIVPSLVGLLKDGGLEDKDFPFATKLLMGLSTVISDFWWLIIFIAVILALIFKTYTGTDNGKFNWDYFKLKFPVVGRLLRRVMVMRFVSMLGILIESGVPVVQSLQIIAKSMSNELYKLKTWEVISRVQKGDKISQSLSEAPLLFDETVVQMLNVGEKSASIGKISDKVADHYDREIDNALKRLTSLFEPILIIFVGITVAILALAILTPIFSLSSLV